MLAHDRSQFMNVSYLPHRLLFHQIWDPNLNSSIRPYLHRPATGLVLNSILELLTPAAYSPRITKAIQRAGRLSIWPRYRAPQMLTLDPLMDPNIIEISHVERPSSHGTHLWSNNLHIIRIHYTFFLNTPDFSERLEWSYWPRLVGIYSAKSSIFTSKRRPVP